MSYSKVLSLQLAAAVANGVAQSQAGVAGTPLTLNGSQVSNGVATFDVARRVLITSSGNDSADSFTITGTNRYGRQMTETVAGGNAAGVYSTKDFLTVSSVVPSANTAGTVTVGTTSIASTAAWIVDTFSIASFISCNVQSAGTSYQIETSNDDLSPAWDLAANTVLWFQSVNGAGNTNQLIEGPQTMLRLTITAGTGLVKATLVQTPGGKGRY